MNHQENRWNPASRPTEGPGKADDVPSQDAESSTATQPAPASTPAPVSPNGAENPSGSSSRRNQALGLELHAILGAGTALDGALSFSGRVRIDGQLEGSATGGDLLVIGEGAQVSGRLHARRVIVLGGHVDADISATESIELYIPAVVRGDLRSPQIYMDRGIQFHGTCDMTLDPPAVELRPDGDDFE